MTTTNKPMTIQHHDQQIAAARAKPGQVRASLCDTAARTQAALDFKLANIAETTPEEITRAYQENELARGAAGLIHKNTNYDENLAIQKYIDESAAAMTQALTDAHKATEEPVPGALKAAFAFVRSLTESIPSLIGLEREGAMKSRDFAESFAPTIAAYREACERRIGVFKSEPTFEHYADACNKIEELKFLISEAAALK